MSCSGFRGLAAVLDKIHALASFLLPLQVSASVSTELCPPVLREPKLTFVREITVDHVAHGASGKRALGPILHVFRLLLPHLLERP